MKAKKSVLALLLAVLQAALCFADPVLNPLEKLNVVNTKYFDVIYPKGSENTAFAIANNCDALYEKAAAYFNEETKMHLPVTIVPGSQVLNAHYTPVPYSHIVIYDTVSTEIELGNYKDSLVEIFYHELVHAVSLSIRKKKEWQNMAKIFGDLFSPNNVIMTTAFAEGATVSLESKEGFGRLNSGFTLNYVVQAKIEDKFPDYYEFHGGKDVYPKGKIPYMFGGAFSQFLQDKYGYEKYAALWSTDEHILMDKFFMEAYGKYINNEWLDFEKSVPVPELADESAVGRINGSEGRYKALVYSRNEKYHGYIYYSIFEEGLYFIKDDLSNSANPKRLCSLDSSVINISVSPDESRLYITLLAADNSETYCTKIFNLDKGRFESKTIKNLLMSQEFTAGGKNYIAGITINNSDSEISIYDAETFEKTKNIPLKHFCEAYNVCEAENGFAFTYKEEGYWSVCVADCSNGLQNISFTNYMLPKEIIPVTISYDRNDQGKNQFTLSVTGRGYESEDKNLPGAMIRLAKVNLSADKSNAQISFQKTDVSGSVTEPVECDGKYAFISKMYEWFYVSYFTDGIPGGLSEPYEMPCKALQIEAPEDDGIKLNSEYKVASYTGIKQMLKRPMLLPAFVPDVNISTIQNKLIDRTDRFGLGLSAVSSLPGENFYACTGAGFNPFDLETMLNLSILGGGKGLIFAGKTGVEFAKTSFKDFYAIGSIYGSRPLFTRNISVEYLVNSNFTYNASNEINLINDAVLGLSYSKHTDSSIHSYFSSAGKITWNDTIKFKNGSLLTEEGEYEKAYIGNIGISQSFHFPQILPVKNPWGFTVNFPLTVSANLIPSSEVFFAGGAKVVLFGQELQCQTGDAPFYLQRYYLTAGATAAWCDLLEPMSIMNAGTHFKQMNLMAKQYACTAGAHLLLAVQAGPLASVSLDCGLDVSVYLKNEVNSKKYQITLFNVITF